MAKSFTENLKKDPRSTSPTEVAGQAPAPKRRVGRPTKSADGRKKKDYCKPITVVVPNDVLDEMELALKARGCTITEYVNDVIVHDLDANRETYLQMEELRKKFKK